MRFIGICENKVSVFWIKLICIHLRNSSQRILKLKLRKGYKMIHIFMIDNGEILGDLQDNISATLTREHYLLNNLKAYDDVDLISIPYKQLPRTNFVNVIYNNIIKSVVALNSMFILLKKKPLVFFTYPSSLTTIQNRILFRFCKYLNLKIILDVQDTIEQSEAIGNGISKLK